MRMSIITKFSNELYIRVSIVLGSIFFIISAFYRDIFSESIEQNFKQLLAYDRYGSLLPPESIGYLLVAVFIVAHVGLFTKSNWGLVLVVVYYLLSALVSLFSGVSVVLPIEAFLSWMVLLIDVVIVLVRIEQKN